jgi:Holliday junction resolvase YEN1
MFYRLCRLLTLNIQLIFVFDGPGRPWKRGKRGQGRINYEERRLLQELLKYLGVPFHEAPGEAEAECARMQILGMVDAVWSQDSDCLMFGCTLWFHDYRVAKHGGVTDRSKENTRKSGKYASVVRAIDLKEKYNLDREGLVLFAMLVGGDYDEKGLPQCGPVIALQAVKQGLGKSLCACRNQAECHIWSKELALFLNTTSRGRSLAVPSGFPDYDILKKYYRPKVTSDGELLTSPRLDLDCTRSIQEHELLKLTSERFNIWGRLYMNWIGPILLTRALVSRASSRPREMVHEIRLIKQRSKDTGEQSPTRTLERKITFSPFGVTNLGRDDFEGPRLGRWDGNEEVPFDPDYRVECEMPEYWLRQVLPAEVFDPSFPTPKPLSKRKRAADDVEEANETPSSKRKFAPHKGLAPDMSTSSVLGSLTQPPKRDSPNLPSTRQPADIIEISDSEDDEIRRVPSRSSWKASPSLVRSDPPIGFGASASFDLAVPSMPRDRQQDRIPVDIADEDDEDLQLALRLSMQEASNPTKPSSNRGKFDDIFAMREAGRSVQGLPVPAWYLDDTQIPDLFSTISPTLQQQERRTLSSRTDFSRIGTHANASRAGPDETDIRRPSPRSSDASTNLASLPANSKDVHVDAKADSSAHTEDSLADIRAARLRRFAASSSAPTVRDAENSVSSIAATSAGLEVQSVKAPADIEYIDLTDD